MSSFFWRSAQSGRSDGTYIKLVNVGIDVPDEHAASGTITLRGDLYLPLDPRSSDADAEETLRLYYEGDEHPLSDTGGPNSMKVAKLVPKPLPTVLLRTPYSKGKTYADLRHPGYFFARNGFACFVQDVRGRFASDGTFYKYVHEATDGEATVAWLARQPWSSGAVFTFGVSYLAHVQAAIAVRPACQDFLKGMFWIKGGFFDAFTSGVRHGGTLEARQWVWACKNAPEEAARGLETIDWVGWLTDRPIFAQGRTPLRHAPAYEKFMTDFSGRLKMNEFWEQAGMSIRANIDSFVDVPLLLLSGWYDMYARSTIEIYDAVRCKPGRVSPTHLIMGPWAHSGEGHVVGDVDFGVEATLAQNIDLSRYALAKRFFKLCMEHDARINGDVPVDEDGVPKPCLEPLPPVLYFRMGGGEGHATTKGDMYHGGSWLVSTSYPPPCAKMRMYLFKSKGRLSRVTDAAVADRVTETVEKFHPRPHNGTLRGETGRVSFSYDPSFPCPTIGGHVFPHQDSHGQHVLMAGPRNQTERRDMFLCRPPFLPLYMRPDVCVWRTQPLQTDMDITGVIEVKLFVSSSCPDTDFTACIVDECPPTDDFPSGFCMNITHSIVRMSQRNVQPVPLTGNRRPDGAGAHMQPEYVYAITIVCYPTSNLFATNHRLAVYISSSNFPEFDLNLNTGLSPSHSSASRIAENTVWLSTSYPSHLLVPECLETPRGEPDFLVVPIDSGLEDDDDDEDEEGS
eukprot:CAMPEP_0170734296 /NCGR_PEP_ID=MMETSP0437-20130122/2519_1 /TAXON_ID=0 /ORGANISM="Sexangularia sp." /LENGTH=736 /DNA_ID=CAMNT_0011072609 /DNA_START=123 /DNA_END=2333 /DNA_ORIENTATION=+